MRKDADDLSASYNVQIWAKIKKKFGGGVKIVKKNLGGGATVTHYFFFGLNYFFSTVSFTFGI